MLTGTVTGLLTSGQPVRRAGRPSLPSEHLFSPSAHWEGHGLVSPLCEHCRKRKALAEDTQAKHSDATSLGHPAQCDSKASWTNGDKSQGAIVHCQGPPRVPFPITPPTSLANPYFPLGSQALTKPWPPPFPAATVTVWPFPAWLQPWAAVGSLSVCVLPRVPPWVPPGATSS